MSFVENIVGRKNELQYLFTFFGKKTDPAMPAVLYIHGDSGTGKTFVMKKLLETSHVHSAFMNCIEAYSSQTFFEQILNKLSKYETNKENNYRSYVKCANAMEFVTELKVFAESIPAAPIVIVLDNCEKLRQYDKDLLPVFFKLKELVGINVCVVLISIVSWTSLVSVSEYPIPVNIYFQKYSRDELIEILKLNQPESFSVSFYEKYLQLFMDIFHQVCHDVNELKYQANKNFILYSEPITKNELSEKDVNALWKQAQPIFKRALKCLYLKMDSTEGEMLTSITTHALKLELPFYLKYMLIGGYMASYNSAAEDKRMFVKNHGKQRRTQKGIRKKVVNQHLLGPKPFGLQRLFAIVTAILDDKTFVLNADLFMGVTTLVKMNLFSQVSPDVLDGGTFKCNASLNFVTIIAQNVSFPIMRYLVDFRNAV